MDHEEIIAMAKEAGFDMSRLPSIRAANVYGEVNDELARFAALVAAKEREACAQVCDRVAQDAALSNRRRCDADALARSIRARGQQEGV